MKHSVRSRCTTFLSERQQHQAAQLAADANWLQSVQDPKVRRYRASVYVMLGACGFGREFRRDFVSSVPDGLSLKEAIASATETWTRLEAKRLQVEAEAGQRRRAEEVAADTLKRALTIGRVALPDLGEKTRNGWKLDQRMVVDCTPSHYVKIGAYLIPTYPHSATVPCYFKRDDVPKHLALKTWWRQRGRKVKPSAQPVVEKFYAHPAWDHSFAADLYDIKDTVER